MMLYHRYLTYPNGHGKNLIFHTSKEIYMRKGVAIPYVIGLLIAIIVLVVAVYLIYLYVIRGEPLSCMECQAKFTAWCSKCYLANWEIDNTIVGTELEQCVQECGHWSTPNDDCSVAKDACKGVGVPPGTG